MCKRLAKWPVAAGWCLLSSLALAQVPPYGQPVQAVPINGAESGAGTTTLGTTSTILQAAATTRRYLAIQVQSTSATVACRTDGGTPALADGVSWQLGAGTGNNGWVWSAPGFVPNGQVNCIASTIGTIVAVRQF